MDKTEREREQEARAKKANGWHASFPAAYLLSLLACQRRSDLLRSRKAFADWLEIVEKRIAAVLCVKEWVATRKAHAGVFARRKWTPLDARLASVHLAEFHLVEREQQCRHEAIRLIVIRYSHATALAADRRARASGLAHSKRRRTGGPHGGSVDRKRPHAAATVARWPTDPSVDGGRAAATSQSDGTRRTRLNLLRASGCEFVLGVGVLPESLHTFSPADVTSTRFKHYTR